MKTIYKYKLQADSNFNIKIEMPIGAEILTMQTQNGEPYIWAIVNPDPEEEKEIRNFEIRETGSPIRREGKYVGTDQILGGALVFHVFEVDKG